MPWATGTFLKAPKWGLDHSMLGQVLTKAGPQGPRRAGADQGWSGDVRVESTEGGRGGTGEGMGGVTAFWDGELLYGPASCKLLPSFLTPFSGPQDVVKWPFTC